MSKMYGIIESLCKRRGVNITTMCREIGISRGNLSDLKMGRTEILSMKSLNKIANYFDVSVNYLLDVEKEKSPDEPKLTEGEELLIELFRRVPEDQQRLVLAMIRAAIEKL